MSSPQHHSFNHRENRNKKFSDRGKVSKPKPQRERDMHLVNAENSDFGRSIFPVSSGTNRRPWPRRKVSGAEEVVRYMSSVPSYLQREENGHHIQEVALNVGVLDWRRLQKWTDNDKLVGNKTCRESPSSSYASSMFSTFHSSSHSSRSNASPPAERKQSSAFDHRCWSNSSSASPSRGRDQRKGRKKIPIAYMIKSQPEDVICLPSAAIGSEHFAFVHSNANRDAARLESEKLRISTEQESCRPHLDSDGGRTNSLHLTAKDRWIRFEEIISGRLDASVLDRGSPRKMSSSRFFGIFPLSPQPSDHKAEGKTSFERGRELSPSTSHLKGIEISDNHKVAVTRSRSRGKRSPIRQLFDAPRQSSSSVASVSDYPDVVSSRSRSRGRRSPVKWLFDPPRNSASSMDPISNNPDVVGVRSSSRGRRSPLRQMFDPPRMSSASVSSTQEPHEPSSIIDDLPPDSGDTSVAYERHSPSRRQALLKLSWKNGLPFLMFSSSDDNILAATMHRRGNSDMNICDCVYVIHTALAIEAKKRNGAWLSHGTKGKKPEFACKFVAELIVSCSERVRFDLSHRSFVREFVLLGDELVPTNSADAVCLSSTELAAIVVESAHQKSESSRCAVLCECSLCIQRIVAILPSGAHGFSDTREPSTLIERWESGGSCDCGGWDEGCALTILTNNSQELNDSTIDGIRCFDLFTEGDARKGKHSYSMIAFKEDMFTVEFKASIPLLQVFAISIAMLHDQNPAGRGAMRNHSVEINGSEYLSFDNYPRVSS